VLAVGMLQQFDGEGAVFGQEIIQTACIDKTAINICDGSNGKMSEIIHNGASASKNTVWFYNLKYQVFAFGTLRNDFGQTTFDAYQVGEGSVLFHDSFPGTEMNPAFVFHEDIQFLGSEGPEYVRFTASTAITTKAAIVDALQTISTQSIFPGF